MRGGTVVAVAPATFVRIGAHRSRSAQRRWQWGQRVGLRSVANGQRDRGARRERELFRNPATRCAQQRRAQERSL